MTLADLPELEFTYAPPFGAAKDPVNMAGYAALNIIEGVSESIQWYELADELAKGMVFLVMSVLKQKLLEVILQMVLTYH